MKFLNFLHTQGPRLGVLLDDAHVLDLTAAWPEQPAPLSVDELIVGGDPALELARHAVKAAQKAVTGGDMSGLFVYADTTILPPVALAGRNIFNVGRNYRDHIIEGNLANGRPADAFPAAIEFFTKPRTALVGHLGQVLRHEKLTNSLDYEVELAIVIGKRGCDIPVEQAHEYIFGYTNSMIFNVATVISQLSAGMTLLPGDVISTGTPKGVGFAQRPPRCLQVGQTIRARIQGIGELTNTIVA